MDLFLKPTFNFNVLKPGVISMFLKSLRFLTLVLACSCLQPLAAANQKCICFDIENVLLFVDSKKSSAVGNMLGYTPEKIQKELDDTLRPLHVKNFTIYANLYAEIVEAWLTGHISSVEAHKEGRHYIKKQCSFLQRTRLTQAIDIACTNKQASVFSPLNDSIALAKRCKSAGCTISISANWNTELFDNLKRVQHASLSFFDEFYISGERGMLAAIPAFYDPIINKYGKDNIVLIDVLPANIKAAQARGIKTIRFTTAAAAERELKKMGFLS
jgi:FMN phosphatase YigB (HAD superfamily)